MTARVTAIVVAWRCGDCLEACLASLAAQELPLEIIVVDNDGQCGPPERWRERFPAIRWLGTGRNVGFAAANNLAIRAAATEYLLTVNADVTLAPDYARRLVEFLDAHPGYGSATGLGLVPGTPPPVCDGTGHFLNRNRTTDGRRRWTAAELETPGDRFGVCAAYALYRRAMLDDVAWQGEYFDESFFSYYEDVDLDWRAQWRGWHSYFLPAAVAWHQRGGSGGMKETSVLVHYYANRWLLLAKNEDAALANRDHAHLVRELHADFERWRYDGVLLRVLLTVIRFLPLALKKRAYSLARRKTDAARMARWYD